MKYRYIEARRISGHGRGLLRRVPVQPGKEDEQMSVMVYFKGADDRVEIKEYDKEMPTVN